MEYVNLVWDGTKLSVPPRMGNPKEDQLAGSDLDNLVELAGRVCYDSLGSSKSRPSLDYHAHIIEVNHGSVWEHANLTFATGEVSTERAYRLAVACLNRPGVHARLTGPAEAPTGLRITTNLRSIREWHRTPATGPEADALGAALQRLAHGRAPLVMQDVNISETVEPLDVQIVPPEDEHEVWASLFFARVSRGFSHELVRHGDETAISQRSTRFVDETNSPWCLHPLFDKALPDNPTLEDNVEALIAHARDVYAQSVDVIQTYLQDHTGAGGFTARKQARGAARGLLGNALETQLIFSASLYEWKHIIAMRASAAADAEIRVVFDEVFQLLQQRFPDQFSGYAEAPCPDGIGLEITAPKS